MFPQVGFRCLPPGEVGVRVSVWDIGSMVNRTKSMHPLREHRADRGNIDLFCTTVPFGLNSTTVQNKSKIKPKDWITDGLVVEQPQQG